MSDRRPEKLYVKTEHVQGKPCQMAVEHVDEATPADLISAVRRGVESGTIKGEVVETDPYGVMARHFDRGTYIVIGPVSDGGSET